MYASTVEKGAVWMEECKLDEVTSKVSAGQSLKEAEASCRASLQGLPAAEHLSISFEIDKGQYCHSTEQSSDLLFLSANKCP